MEEDQIWKEVEKLFEELRKLTRGTSLDFRRDLLNEAAEALGDDATRKFCAEKLEDYLSVLQVRIQPKSTAPKRGFNFEAQIARNLLALIEGGSGLIHCGPLGDLGEVSYIGYRDLAAGMNALLVCQVGNEERFPVSEREIGMLCRDAFGLCTVRTGAGWVVVLDKKRISAFLNECN